MARLSEAIDKMTALSSAVQQPEEEMRLTSLPIQFHPLIPLIKKWGILDDDDRQHFLDEQPRPALKRLVEEIEPYLSSIDSYLDSFGKRELPDEATALGRLAECALEAKRTLEN